MKCLQYSHKATRILIKLIMQAGSYENKDEDRDGGRVKHLRGHNAKSLYFPVLFSILTKTVEARATSIPLVPPGLLGIGKEFITAIKLE